MKTSTLAVLAVMSLSFASAYAQQQLNSDTIYVDGELQAGDAPVTDGELEKLKGEYRDLKNQTQISKEKAKVFHKVAGQVDKFADAQDEMIDGAVERQHALNGFQEKKAQNEMKLKCIMENLNTEECKKWVKPKNAVVEQPVHLTQAAAVPANLTQESVEADVETFGPFQSIKLLPYLGATSYKGKVESLESELAGGLRLESNINSRFTMGVGFNMSQFKTQDFANGVDYMNSGYMGMYGGGREIQFRTMGIDLYGKFFITNGARFRPYVGAALGMNRATLKYTNNNPYTNMYGIYGNEEYQTTYAIGALSGGSEIMITRSVGINIEATYSTGLGASMNSQNQQNLTSSPDQRRLRDLGSEIINANALSLFAGMVVVF